MPAPIFSLAIAPVRLIISVPPATTQSSMPDMTCAAARLTEVIPPPQNRSSVVPLLVTS